MRSASRPWFRLLSQNRWLIANIFNRDLEPRKLPLCGEVVQMVVKSAAPNPLALGALIVGGVVGIGVSIGFGLVFLTQFQTIVGENSTAGIAIGKVITAITDNILWIGLIMLAGLGGVAYMYAKGTGMIQ